MADFLSGTVAEHGAREALSDGERSWSYRELDAVVAATAARLRARGARPGRTVATVLPTSAEAVVAVHAVLRTGALLAPLRPGLAGPELRDAMTALEPTLLLGSAVSRSLAGSTADGGDPGLGSLESGPTLLEDEAWFPGWEAGRWTRAEGAEPGAVPATGDARPVAALWTSGTSGARRGVLLGAAALRHSALASRRRLALGPDDRWYASLSVAHVGGLALVVRAALLGSCLVATGPFDARELGLLLDRGRVTHASLVPVMLRRLLDRRAGRRLPSTVGCLLVGGAACPPALVRRAVEAGAPVALTYGLTEATSQVATAPPELVRRAPDTVGPPLDGVEVRTDGADEILVRGPTLALGVVGGGRLVDDDGWLATGDLGRLDGEGHLRVTGRRSERIISGGVNVDPVEVEAALTAHPAVAEAGVVGLPDPEWGERLVAAVVFAEGVGSKGEPGETGAEPEDDDLRAWSRSRLSGAAVPKEFVRVRALPRNAAGKLDRPALRRIVE